MEETTGTANDIRIIYNSIDEMAKAKPEEQLETLETIERHLAKMKRIKDSYTELIKAAYPRKSDRQNEAYPDRNNEANLDRKGETILHRAVKKLSFESDNEIQVIKSIKHQYKNLVNEDRRDTDFAGQTPLHIAITKGVPQIAKCLKPGQINYRPQDGLGAMFSNTVMMAELPLSVAALRSVASNKTPEALRNDQKMFEKLIKLGAKLDAVNNQGDNICHSLIRYAYLYPDKCELVTEMMKYITDVKSSELDADTRNIWRMKNHEGLTPLLLATKFGKHEIFKFIMNLEDYCFQNDSDGLFDIKMYDVTDMDALSFKEKTETSAVDGASKQNADAHEPIEGKTSVLRRLLELDPKCAFQFIQFTPIQRIIDRKWKAYRWYFYPWFILHVIYMSCLTWYGTHRSLQNTNVDGGFDVSMKPNFTNPILAQPFSLKFGILNILVGIVVLTEAFIRFYLNRMPLRLSSVSNPYSNATFRFLFCVFGLFLIGDFIFAATVARYENHLLMLAVCIGWFLMLFFLRALRPFSYFTVMIQNVLVGDMLRFSIILLCELFAFATVMFMAVQGASEVDSEYNNYGRVLLSMFKLMVGLGDVGLLYKTRYPTVTILIVVAFIILTTLLMVNSLIALISRTSEEIAYVEETGVTGARDMHWKLQRLSLVLYIESILPDIRFIRLVGEKGQHGSTRGTTRLYLEIRSLLNADDSNSVNEEPRWTSGLTTALQRTIREQFDKVQHLDSPNTRSQDELMSTNGQSKSPRSSSETMRSSFWTTRSLQPSMEIYNHQLCNKCSEITE